jgi:hypothetical protein
MFMLIQDNSHTRHDQIALNDFDGYKAQRGLFTLPMENGVSTIKIKESVLLKPGNT